MSSFPGLNDPFLALSLVAISPELKGVMIGGPTGTGKSVLARASKALFPEGSPFINIPLGCTMDRLVGGINLEESQKSGKLKASQGLLAAAHNGVLYIDEINLLPKELASVILQALMSEEVIIEREGISFSYPSKFTLIGTYNPQEAELPKAFSDRVGFIVYSKTISHLGWRMSVASKADKMLSIPPDVIERVKRARRYLPKVEVRDDTIQKLVEFASKIGVQGNRFDIFALECAKANAALHLRFPITDTDIYLAMRLIYMSRFGESSMPGDEDLDSEYKSDKSNRKKESPNSDVNSRKGKGSKNKKEEKEQEQNGGGDQRKEIAKSDVITEYEEDDLEEFELPEFKGKTENARHAGNHLYSTNFQRGRHIRSIPGIPSKGRIDLLATLKSAAIKNLIKNPNSKGIQIRKEDFHIKQYQQKSGLLFIFAVDGSGSMAINHFEAARGAALSLLEKAYVFRDKVSLIYFRHKEAKLLLTPGCSLTKAATALKKIKAGGKTPVSTALLKTLELAKRNKSNKEVPGVVLILFTDGKANQPHKEIKGVNTETTCRNELKSVCQLLKNSLTTCLLFDTRIGKMENPYGLELASWLGAKYIRMQKASTESILHQVNESTGTYR